jgi:hypothetical protein
MCGEEKLQLRRIGARVRNSGQNLGRMCEGILAENRFVQADVSSHMTDVSRSYR